MRNDHPTHYQLVATALFVPAHAMLRIRSDVRERREARGEVIFGHRVLVRAGAGLFAAFMHAEHARQAAGPAIAR
jgi:hypothetical protein